MILGASEYASFLVKHGDQIGQHFDGRKLEFVERFCVGVIHRQVILCQSILQLLDGSNNSMAYEVALGIILRAMLLDSLLTLDLYVKIDSSSTDEIKSVSEKFCEEVLIDDASRSVSQSINNMAHSGVLSPDEQKKLLEKFPVKKNATRYGAGEIEKRLAHGNLKEYVNDIVRTYDIYSKYDHYNAFYFKLQKEPNKVKVERIVRSLRYIGHTLVYSSLILSHFHPEDETLSTLVSTVVQSTIADATNNVTNETGVD